MKTRRKHYRNSLRLFLIFVGGIILLGTNKFFAFFGGIGIVGSTLGFLINAEVIK